MGKNTGKYISKKLSGKYGTGMLAMLQKLPVHAKKYVIDAFKKSSKWVIQKTAQEIGDLIGNKIANRITIVTRNSQENNLETVKNEYDKEIPKERYVYPEERQEIVDELILE